MRIAEPTTVATNLLLAIFALALGWRLRAAAAPPARRSTCLWAGAFAAGAVAALAGGIVHGPREALPAVVHDVAWRTVLVGSGLACALLAAGAAVAALDGATRRNALVATATILGAYLGLVAQRADVRLAAALGATTIAALLALALATPGRNAIPLAGLLLALGLCAAGLVAQHARLAGPGPFNHNDVCHLLQTAALWPFYRAGLRLRDRPSTRGWTEP